MSLCRTCQDEGAFESVKRQDGRYNGTSFFRQRRRTPPPPPTRNNIHTPPPQKKIKKIAKTPTKTLGYSVHLTSVSPHRPFFVCFFPFPSSTTFFSPFFFATHLLLLFFFSRVFPPPIIPPLFTRPPPPFRLKHTLPTPAAVHLSDYYDYLRREHRLEKG